MGHLCVLSYHLKVVKVWLFSFQFVSPLSPFVVLLITRMLSTRLNRNGESGPPCLIPDSGMTLSFSPHLIWFWLLTCCILSSVCLCMLLVSLISTTPLSWRSNGFCQRLLELLMRKFVFALSVCLYDGLHWKYSYLELFYQLWDEAYFITVDDFFWCVLWFGLPVFYWVYFHKCSWGVLVFNSVFCSIFVF